MNEGRQIDTEGKNVSLGAFDGDMVMFINGVLKKGRKREKELLCCALNSDFLSR